MFCDDLGIDHNFSATRTPQLNGVVERNNRTLEEMARTMLCENNLPKYFWMEAVNTAWYVINCVMIRSILKKTPYELWKGRKPKISHLRAFGCKCFVLNNNKDNLGNLMLIRMKLYFLVILYPVKLIEYSIKELYLLKNLCMVFLMNLTILFPRIL